MNDFQIQNKKRSKLSLYRNNKSNNKPKNMPQGLKSILITNSNGLEISSQFGNFLHFSKKNMLDENFSFKRLTTNYNKNKNTSYPLNTGSNIKNFKQKEGSIINLKSNLYKKKFEKYLTNSKKNDSSKNHNSKDRTNSNNNIMNNITGLMLNRSNMKLNIFPKKSNLKYIHYKENNLSINSNKNIGKSTSISKSKSRRKNRRENKSFSNNMAKMFFNKYLRLKFDKIGLRKKSHKKSFGYLNKESPRLINNKFSNEINISEVNKMNSFNLIKNIQFKGIKKKNKSSNFLLSNINNINNINSKQKNNNAHNSRTNSNNIIISKIETNKIGIKNNKIGNKNNLGTNNININSNKISQNDKNNKKYLTENHIMYVINKKNSGKNKNQKKPITITTNKNKQISLKEIKSEINANGNVISKNENNNNNYINLNLNKYNINYNNNNNNSNDKPKIDPNENVIYDYKTNKKFFKNNDNNKLLKENKNIFCKKANKLINNTNTNPNINEIENSVNTYKILNERLKTEYNDISLEAIDKMYEQDQETNESKINKNILSKKDSEENSFRFLYPDGDIYNRDDEFFIENNEDNLDNNEKREKELDETESPLKMDTDKVSVENSGVLSFDQVKDIICYFNMNNTDKQSEFLFQNKEREIFDMNYKNKYLNFFFGNKENENGIGFGGYNEINNNNDLTDEIMSLNTFNLKYPNNSIFSMDTEYSSKMKKKYNKNLVKNI